MAWIGIADLRSAQGEMGDSLGPIGQAACKREYSHIYLLSDHTREAERAYRGWLKTKTEAEIKILRVKLTGPTNFGEIYEAAVSGVNSVREAFAESEIHLTYHLSPGTPAMAAVWIILAKTSHPAQLIESSIEVGVRTVLLPFDISADYLPEILGESDNRIIDLTQGLPPETPEFDAIIHRCKPMKELIAQARRVAVHDVPVLIQGESGTGKELFARAIHSSGPRSEGPFVDVNCGAIPLTLIESELFGHVKGAFTGADRDRKGHLESADGGTLFLDEIGALPLDAQVKLLRALQEKTIQKVGSTRGRGIDIRVIAATNRNLLDDVSERRFRSDLFHRLAVGVIQIPPLRERKGDINLLIDHCLDQINTSFSSQPGWKHKNISAGARNLMAKHPWPGNVRELFNALSRAVIWTTGETIQPEDIQRALFPVTLLDPDAEHILNRSLGKGLSLPDLFAEVARHYLSRALLESHGNKTEAAKLVGLPNYQTFTNWLKKFDVAD